MRSCSTLVLLGMVLLANPVAAQRSGDVPYSQATFEVSQSPTKVVLQVVTNASLSGEGHSMTVYGDGVVELQKVFNGQTVLDRRRIDIGTDGAHDLIRRAVASGLAEWDDDTISAWMRQSGKLIPIVADGLRVRVAISLDAYRRGSYERSSLSLTFSVKSPRNQMQFYPEITQFRGAQDLVEWLQVKWKEAEKGEG